MTQHEEGRLRASLVVGVTGHRDLREGDIPALREQIRAFFAELQARYPELPLMLLSSLAQGSDQLAAEVAFELGLRVVAPLPMPADLYRVDFEDARARALFDQQVQRAELLQIPVKSGNTRASVEGPGPARDHQYALAGIFVSSHCHILLALWDGRESELLGGTAQVVRYHLHGTMPGWIDRRQAPLSLLGLDEETLVYHLPTGRQGNATELPALDRWLTAGTELVRNAEMPRTFDQMFRRQAMFNVDALKYADRISPEPAASPGASNCAVYQLFEVADALARMHQARVNRVLRATYALAAAMGFALIMYSDLFAQDTLIYLFLAMFLSGVVLAGIAKRREWHRKYLDYRALAEGLRVQSFWRRAGIPDIDSPSFAHDNFLQKQDVELGWIRNAMRGASVEGMLQPAESGADELDAVIQEWLGTEESDGQLRYYSVTAAKRERLHRRSELLGDCCLWLGLGISVLLAVFAQKLEGGTQNVLVAMMGVLSVAAAVHEAYAYKKADKELIKQYRFMLRIFEAARRRLEDCTGAREKRQLLHALGEAALAEHAEWTLMHRERPLEHSRI